MRAKNASSGRPPGPPRSASSGTETSQLIARLRRLEALALLDPAVALPGIAVLVRGTSTAMRPGVKPGLLIGHLRRAADGLEVES